MIDQFKSTEVSSLLSLAVCLFALEPAEPDLSGLLYRRTYKLQKHQHPCFQ